ncbi:protein disulfide-isomerase A6-like [Apostichopus japonicus]|uniref:protein disulfide-isomerase A6-like n=1 Tax=Stichopus japonicus TaxID=307972 RepID=UPI003AB26CC5
MNQFIGLAILAVAISLSNAKSDVIQLTPEVFNDKVVNSDSVWLVEFFAPWCGHCKSLAPEWEKVATALKGVVKVGAVDADQHKSLGSQFGVRGFPTIKIFGLDKSKPEDYQGGRTAPAIVDKALEVAKKTVKDRLGGKSGGKSGGGGGSSGGKSGGSGGNGGGKDAVVTLTDSNFEELVYNSKEPWLVEFFAPWCGHCKNLAPEFAQAASELKGTFKLGALDATAHTIIASRFGIQGYPTLKYFPVGSGGQSDAQDYDGGRQASGIVSWCMDKAADLLPTPEVKEIVDDAVLKEACEESPLCIIAALPHILDTGADGRNTYIKMMTELADKYKQRHWGWVWTEAGKQQKLEDTLGFGGFGYPALAAVNARKKKLAVFKGSFSIEGLGEFMRAVAVGRGSTEPLRGDTLPTVDTVEPWDGKDGELPVEDDIDLSDFDMDDEEDSGKDEL